MKKILFSMMLLATLAFPATLFADTSMENSLSFELDAGIGGTTTLLEDAAGAPTVTLHPSIAYFPIEDLGVFVNFGWEHSWMQNPSQTKTIDIDAYPVIFGVDYYLELTEKVDFIAGGGLGFTVMSYDGYYDKDTTFDREVATYFSIDIHAGIQGEIADNFALQATFDIFMPNIAPIDQIRHGKFGARFAVMGGFAYYFPLENNSPIIVGDVKARKRERVKVDEKELSDDLDGDGIPNNRDRCPNKKEDADGYQDTDGCPDVDNDGDGFLDEKDKCPSKPENINGKEDTDGCPD